jgi:hypothetical protein
MSINQDNQPSESENKSGKSNDSKKPEEQKPSGQKPKDKITPFDLRNLDSSDYSENR